MKSFKMKALALATLGLAGFAFAGAASAACPTAVTTVGSSSPGGGGAWTSQYISSDATFGIAGPGLAGTNCALSLSIGASSSSRAFVSDSSPQNEQRYRARFYLSTNALSNLTATNQSVVLFRANDATGPAQFSSDQLVVRLVGGSPATVRFYVADLNSAGSGVTPIVVTLPTSATNTYRVEFDMQVGTGATTANGCNTMPASGGCFRYWVTDAAATSADGSPTGSSTVNNSGWGGVKTAVLGMAAGSPSYRSNHAGGVLVFDEFDSRRQTFIGQ
ncbi:MAG: hypothetical protein JSR27_05500 [Proteobacteria bacterium]|nr:hypothetical protein [Pseudomonadota bacterium]